jgi:hypothetical protein
LKRILAKADEDFREEHDKKDMNLRILHDESDRIIHYIETEREHVRVPADTARIYGSGEASPQASGVSPTDESQAPIPRLTARQRYERFQDLVNSMVHDDRFVRDALMTHEEVPFASISHVIVQFASALLVNIELHSLDGQTLVDSLSLKLREWQSANREPSAQV